MHFCIPFKWRVRNSKTKLDRDLWIVAYEYGSAYDFNCPFDFEKRIEYLKELYHIYGTEYVNSLSISDESQINDFGISMVDIKYSPKLKCTEEVIVKDFKSIWPQFNRI